MNKFLYILFFPIIAFSQSSLNDVAPLFQTKKYAEAETLIANYIKTHPNNLYAMELLGDAHGYQKKWDDAIGVYKKLIDSNQNNANYHYKYGGALGMKARSINKFRALGLIDDVKKAFLKSSELDPNHIDARWALVEFYVQLPGVLGGSKNKSMQYANELESLSKVDGYLAKGYIFENDKEAELAEKYYKLAITEGGSLTCFEKLTTLYEDQNKPKKAIANIEQAYEKHNQNNLCYQIGKVSADYNLELDKGERCLKMYIKNHSAKDGVPIEWGYFRLAQISKNRLQKAQALQWINKALKVRSNFKLAIEEKAKIMEL